jgi:hypothetical protein
MVMAAFLRDKWVPTGHLVMRVVGARQLFFYGPEAGSAAVFDARLYHISEPPESHRAHLKLCAPQTKVFGA